MKKLSIYTIASVIIEVIALGYMLFCVITGRPVQTWNTYLIIAGVIVFDLQFAFAGKK